MVVLTMMYRMNRKHVLILGSVGGPHSPNDLNSFAFALRKEIVTLATVGVQAWDGSNNMMPFRLRAYLGYFHGDMLAIKDLMNSRGPNCKLGCKYCRIIRIPLPLANTSNSEEDTITVAQRGNTHNYFPRWTPGNMTVGGEDLNRAGFARVL